MASPQSMSHPIDHVLRQTIHSDARSTHLVILPLLPHMAPKLHSPPRPPRKPRVLRPITDWAPSREDFANAFLQNSHPNRPLSSHPALLPSTSAALPRPSPSPSPSTSSRRPPAPPRPKPGSSFAPKPGPSLKRKPPPAQRFVFLEGPPPPAQSGPCPPPPRSKPKPKPVPVVDLTRSPSPPVTIPSSHSSPLFEIPTVYQQLRRARKQPPVAEPSAPQPDIPPDFHLPKRPRKLPPIAGRVASPTDYGSASQQLKRPNPKKHPRPAEPSSPTIEIPTVYQELRRARKLQRTGEADAGRSNFQPSPARDRGPPSSRPAPQRVAGVPISPSPAPPPSPHHIGGPSRLAGRRAPRERSPATIVLASSPHLEPEPLATPRARLPAASPATSHPQNVPGLTGPDCAKNSFRTPKAVRHTRLSNSPCVTASGSTSSSAAHVASILLGPPPVHSPCAAASGSTPSSAAHVASILLGPPPLLSPAPSPSPGLPPPRFLSADLKLLPMYLLKSCSALSTSCASLVVRPEPVPGLPLDASEERHARDDRWRVRHELIGATQVGGRTIDCWALGDKGWPARLFTVCGWLVGIDRRERHLTYYIDDGTAVLECQLPITRLATIFEPVSTPQDGSNSELDKPQRDGSKAAAAPTKRPRSDPRLDAYRRLSPPRRAAPGGAPRGRVGAAVRAETAAPVSEATIEQYATLALGLTLTLTGQPRDMFRGTKRVLDAERARVVVDVAEEIRFRNELRGLRKDAYCRPFRLANVWPDARVAGADDSPVGVSKGGGVEEQTVKPSPRRLRLPPVRSLSVRDLTIAKFQSYIAHHILTVYSPLPGPAAIRPSDLLREPELRLFTSRLTALEQASANSQEGLFLGHGSKGRKAEPEELVRRAIRALVNQGTLIISPFDESVFALPNVHTLGPVLRKMFMERKKLMTTEEVVNCIRRDELWKHVLENCVLDVLEQVADRDEKGKWAVNRLSS